MSQAAARAGATRRLFFALWPDSVCQVALADATHDVVLASGGRPVPPQNFHITLAFLGSVPEARVPAVVAIGATVAAEAGPLSVAVILASIEYWKKPRVLCAVASETSMGAPLSELLKANLTNAGFTPDLKPFRAHVTLARKAIHSKASFTMRPVTWSFPEFVLVESRTEPHGSVYSVLHRYTVL